MPTGRDQFSEDLAAILTANEAERDPQRKAAALLGVAAGCIVIAAPSKAEAATTIIAALSPVLEQLGLRIIPAVPTLTIVGTRGHNAD